MVSTGRDRLQRKADRVIYSGERWRPRLARNDLPIVALDTEDDSKGKVVSVAMTDGRYDEVFNSADDARDYFAENDLGAVQIWAHNLEYDLVNVFRGCLGACRWQYYGGRLVRATLYGSRVVFRDSLNLLRMSLEKAGKIVGLRKLKFDPNSRKYVVRDARIVHKIVTGLRSYLRKLGGDLKGTAGACALYLWATRYADLPLPGLTWQTRAVFRLAYYGGRVEVYRYGKVKGRLSYMDVNSMYPSVMRGEYPDIWTLQLGGHHGIAKARVTVPDCPYPPLPFRNEDGKIFYPTGTWTAHYCTNELEYAESLGVKVKVIRRLGSDDLSTPFRSYVEDLYPRRRETRNETEKAFLKLLLNSLYGKFGTGGGGASEIRPIERMNGKAFQIVDSTAGMVERSMNVPRYANVLWSAWTTAAARILLHKAILKSAEKGREPLYCDTDSLIVRGAPPFKCSTALGAWKLESRLQELDAHGPKNYYFRAGQRREYRVKGVPREQYRTVDGLKVKTKPAREVFETGETVITRPMRLRESSRARDGVTIDGVPLGANIWTEMVKKDRKPDPRRCILKDGSTRAPRI